MAQARGRGAGAGRGPRAGDGAPGGGGRPGYRRRGRRPDRRWPAAHQGAEPGACLIGSAAPRGAPRRPPAAPRLTPRPESAVPATAPPAAQAPRAPMSGKAIAHSHFDRAANLINLETYMRRILLAPFREVTVEVPVRMDDGRIEVFTGYRIQHNGARGTGKGGIRYHPAA